MSIRLLIATVVALGATQHLKAAPRELTPVPVGDQELFYSNGQPFIFSEGRSTVLQISVEGEDSRRVWLTMSFTNLGDSPALVVENPVRARAITSAGEVGVRVIPGSELEQRERRRQMWENIGAGVASGLNAYNAGQQGHGSATTTHRGTVSGYGSRSGYVRGSYSGTSTTSYYDPAAAQAARAEAAASNQRMFESLKNDQEVRTAALSAATLKTHTLGLGETYSGRLQIELPRKQQRQGVLIALDVSLGDETHPFLFLADGVVAQDVMARGRKEAEGTLTSTKAESPEASNASETNGEILGAESRPADSMINSKTRATPTQVAAPAATLEAPAAAAASEASASSLTSSSAVASLAAATAHAVFTGEIRPLHQPVRISLNDAQYEATTLLEVEIRQSERREPMMRTTTKTKASQHRDGDLVLHEQRIESTHVEGGGENSAQLEEFLTGLSFKHGTTPQGRRRGPITITTSNGQTMTADVADDLENSLRFSTRELKVGDVAATSVVNKSNQGSRRPSAFAAVLGEPIEWRLAGAVVHEGRDAYLLNAISSSSLERTHEGESAGVKVNIRGFSIVDAISGILLQQEIDAALESHAGSDPKSDIRIRISKDAVIRPDMQLSRWVPVLTKITTTSIRRDDGTIADQVFLDLRWTADGAPRGSSGRLLVRHIGIGQTVSLPWQIPQAVVAANGGIDSGFGFDVSTLGEASKWLPSASLQQLEVSFEPGN